MRKTFRLGLLELFALLLLVSCGGPKTGKKQMPPSKGLPFELLLIVDESLWNSTSRDSIESVLKGSVPGLPQNEAQFRLLRIFPQNLTARYTTFRNILEMRLNPNLKQVEMQTVRNVNAAPQIYVGVFAPNKGQMNAFLRIHGDELVDVLVDAELQYEAVLLRKTYSKIVSDAVRKTFSYNVNVPADIKRLKIADNFVWASTDRLEKDLNFVCYSVPYVSRGDRFMAEWVAQRDSAMKRNIPGSTPDKWMTTTVEEGKPLVLTTERILSDGRSVYEMRGLWEMRKGAIGGPFVSLAFPDSVNDRILVAEGFVYSPETNKRDLMRRMEAALRTFVPIN